MVIPLLLGYEEPSWFKIKRDRLERMDVFYPHGFAGAHVYYEMPESYNWGTALTSFKMKKLYLTPTKSQKVTFVFKKMMVMNGQTLLWK